MDRQISKIETDIKTVGERVAKTIFNNIKSEIIENVQKKYGIDLNKSAKQ